MPDSDSTTRQPMEKNREAMSSGQRAMMESMQLPLDQFVEFQRSTTELMLNSLETQERSGRRAVELARSAFDDYLDAVQQVTESVTDAARTAVAETADTQERVVRSGAAEMARTGRAEADAAASRGYGDAAGTTQTGDQQNRAANPTPQTASAGRYGQSVEGVGRRRYGQRVGTTAGQGASAGAYPNAGRQPPQEVDTQQRNAQQVDAQQRDAVSTAPRQYAGQVPGRESPVPRYAGTEESSVYQPRGHQAAPAESPPSEKTPERSAGRRGKTTETSTDTPQTTAPGETRQR